MSGPRNIPNDGQALTTPDFQRVGDGAAAADDRAYEVLLTPRSLQKRVLPLQQETASVFPRILVVPSGTSGKLSVAPALFVAGSPSNALGVALAAAVKSAMDSGLLAANSSGSTRYDLLYATVQRTVDLTASRVIKSTSDGSEGSQTVNVQDSPTVTLGIIQNVASDNPTASLPADSNGGLNGEAFGSYNFALAMIAVPNGYALNGAASAAWITQLWNGGFVPSGRVHGMKAMSIYTSALNEKPLGSLPTLERWGSDQRFFGHLRLFNTTPTLPISNALVLDNSIDWRQRVIFIFASLLFTGSPVQLDTLGFGPNGSSGDKFSATFTGTGGSGFSAITYNTSTNLYLTVDASTGALKFYRSGSVLDSTNGDAIALFVIATDQFVTGM